MCFREHTTSTKISHCKSLGNMQCRKIRYSLKCTVMQVSVMTPSRPNLWTRTLTEDESRLGRALAGGHIPSVAKAVMRSGSLRNAVILRVLDQLDNECVKLCQVSSPSLFSKVPLSTLEEFEWDKFIQELQERAPLLFQILSTIASRNDHRNQCKTGKAHYPGICMAAAVILKERSQRMTGVQSVMSLLLFASHVDKQVRGRSEDI